MPSIGEILARNARRVPTREALVYGDKRYTYREFDDMVNQAANVLSHLGVTKGDRVALMAFNSDDFIFAYYGVLKLGAIIVPTNMRLAPPELAYQLQDSGARLILHAEELTPVVEAAIQGMKPEAETTVFDDAENEGVAATDDEAVDFAATEAEAEAEGHPVQAVCLSRASRPSPGEQAEDKSAQGGGAHGGANQPGDAANQTENGAALAATLRERMLAAPVTPPAIEVREDDDAQILYTSGTTGKPKGVLLDHHRIIWTGLNVIMNLSVREGDRLLHVAPLYHSAELDLFLMAGTLMAATHIVMREFHPTEVLKAMEREQITSFFGVPTMYQFMLRDPFFTQADLQHWRLGMFGAAPMPPSAVKQLAELAPQVALYNLCGLTEMGPGGVYLGGQELIEHPHAAGGPTMNTESRVVRDDFSDVAPGEVGELIFRGETLMKGYWNNPAATEATMRDGWLLTGDLATVDEDGRVVMVDRKKDMILTGGMNVYSVEVEYAVVTHPSVADCAVIGVPHPDYGETVTAVVNLTPGSNLTVEELRDHCRPLIADYKIPRRLIIAPIMRNASGKVLKYQLREAHGNVGRSESGNGDGNGDRDRDTQATPGGADAAPDNGTESGTDEVAAHSAD